eukprot:1712416-Pleurochrysis_carterae.AAC.1
MPGGTESVAASAKAATMFDFPSFAMSVGRTADEKWAPPDDEIRDSWKSNCFNVSGFGVTRSFGSPEPTRCG